MSQQEVISSLQPEVIKPGHRLRRLGQAVIAKAIEHAPDAAKDRAAEIMIKRIASSQAFEVRYLVESEDASKALELEQSVWHEKDYGDLGVYEKYLPQSRIFAAFDGEKCIGMNRLFDGAPELPPFIAEMPIDSPDIKSALIDGSKDFQVEEFGTVALDAEYRKGRVFMDLCRASYRDATGRGIEIWGIIMEPDRVQKMNKFAGFTFEQIGPTMNYQGGDVAAHIMHFDDVRTHMSATKPQLYDWFVNKPLGT